ncbi:MAG: hypothetical protein ACYTGX_19505 [Planctomycetota bacterium]|jgi:hypothetical protein
MAHVARDRLGADWVLNNDADEFWLPEQGTLRDAVRAADAAVLACPRTNLICANDAPESEPWPERLRYRIARPVAPPSLADPQRSPFPAPFYYWDLPGKVLCRTAGLRAVHQGNHDADFDRPVRRAGAAIRIYHVPYRTRAQFLAKIRQGGAAYARNRTLPVQLGWHWRRWYARLDAGEGPVVEEVLPSSARLTSDLASGVVTEDDTLRRSLPERPAPGG